MRITRPVLGLLCVVAGAIPPHVMYAMSEDGNLFNPVLFGLMAVAAVTAFFVFAVSRRLSSSSVGQFAVGVLGCYASFLALLVIALALTGEAAEALMWMPVTVFFGIPFMAPLVVMAWLGSVLVFAAKNNLPE